MRVGVFVVAVIGGTLGAAWAQPAGEGETPCQPACSAGAVCVRGTCMVPAPAAMPAPGAAAAPPPGYVPAAGPPPYASPPPQPPPYAAPPPGYAPLGYYAPQQPARRAPTGFLALPYIGIHSLSGDGSSAFGPGLRLGALLGGRVGETFSANGEITLDVMNPDEPPGVDVNMVMMHLTFSPLFHVATPSAEFVIGPKIGVWALTGEASGAIAREIEQEGWTLGANAGVFFPVGRGSSSLGMLLSYGALAVTRTCVTMPFAPKECTEAEASGSVTGFSFAALF